MSARITEAMVEALAKVLLGRVNAPEQETYRAARDGLAAALSTEGETVLVPREPTEEMLTAAALADHEGYDNDAAGVYREMWRAMLAAAPPRGYPGGQAMSIEKIERDLREAMTGVENLHWETRGVFNLSSSKMAAADAFTDLCSPENIRALLDEISRLREALKGIRDAANSFQDEEGYEVAAQIRIRVDAAISEREGQDG